MRRTVAGVTVLLGLVCAPLVARAAASNPVTVGPGGTVPVHADGFAPHAEITVAQTGTTVRRHARAGADGAVDTTWRAPRTAGTYHLLVVGGIRYHERAVALPSASAGTDPQAVVVAVPRVVGVPFVVVTGSGVQGVHTGGHHGHGAGAGSGAGSGAAPAGAGSLASTGLDSGWLLESAAALLLAGAGTLIAARRRRPTAANAFIRCSSGVRQSDGRRS